MSNRALAMHYENIGETYESRVHYMEYFTEKLPENGKILDAGCSNGNLAKVLMEKGHDVAGIDISSTAIKRARKRGVKAYCGNIEDMYMFSNNQFDLVLSTETIEHVESPTRALLEINRVLRPRGKLILTTPNVHHFVRLFYNNHCLEGEILNKHVNCFDLVQWKIILNCTGFIFKSSKGFPNTWIYPRWKGAGKILDRLFPVDRFKQYLIIEALKWKTS